MLLPAFRGKLLPSSSGWTSALKMEAKGSSDYKVHKTENRLFNAAKTSNIIKISF
jgi:hypothetical protein